MGGFLVLASELIDGSGGRTPLAWEPNTELAPDLIGNLQSPNGGSEGPLRCLQLACTNGASHGCRFVMKALEVRSRRFKVAQPFPVGEANF